MKITLDFDPSDEKDIDQLIETLKGLGVLKKVEKDRHRHVHTLPVHVLSNYNTSPNIEYTDALEKAGKAIVQLYNHFGEKGSKKIKGIGENNGSADICCDKLSLQPDFIASPIPPKSSASPAHPPNPQT